MAVTDSALLETNEFFKLGDKLIAHTSGAVSKDVLQNISNRYGVIYPLQSLRKENMLMHSDIPLFVDGNEEAVIESLIDFAATISKTINRATDEQRLKLHIAWSIPLIF